MTNLLRLFVLGALVVCAFLLVGVGMARSSADLLAPVHLLLFVVAVAFYLLPAALAHYRNCQASMWITILNVFLGWTVFGWVAAIGWAASGKVRTLPPVISAPPTHPVPSN